nr:hypothetical protein [Tanacetum cinerariifolium]
MGVEAYLRGLLGLGKRASNVRIVWFSFGFFEGGSFESVSFSSSTKSKNVVHLRLLWKLLQLLRPLAEKYVDIASFSFRGSELVKGASSSHGCLISLERLPYQSFDLVRSFDLPVHASVAQVGFCLFFLKDFPFVLVIDMLYFPLDVVEDALAQGDDGLGLMKNEDHQVLGNEQKLEEDAFCCTRVDDDGAKFSLEGGDYFPTMGDETKKDKLFIFLLLLIICIVLMLMDRASYAYSCERLLLKAKATFFEQPTMHVASLASGLNTPKENRQRFYEHSTQSIGELTEFKSGRMQQGTGLDEQKHDLSTKESKAALKSSYFVPGANIEPNKAGLEEVVDPDQDQLPTLDFVVLVSSIIPISNISHKTFAHTLVSNVSEFNKMTKSSVPSGALFVLLSKGLMTPDLVYPSTYQLLWSSSDDSGPDMSFDIQPSRRFDVLLDEGSISIWLGKWSGFGPDIPIYQKKKTEEGMVDSQPKEEFRGAATPRKLAYIESDKEALAGSLVRGFFDRFSLESSDTFDTRKQTRSASKSQRTPSKNKDLTHLRRSRRLDDQSITKEKARRERSKPKGKRFGHQETSSDSEREEAFMHGHGHLKLAKKLNDKIPKMMDEKFERVRAFIKGEVATRNININISSKLRRCRALMVSFLGETHHPLGVIDLRVIMGRAGRSKTVLKEFVIIKCHSPYNVIIGRTKMRSLGAGSLMGMQTARKGTRLEEKGRGRASIDNGISVQMFPMTFKGIQQNKDDRGRRRKYWVSYGGRSILFHPYAKRIKELRCYTLEDDVGGLS